MRRFLELLTLCLFSLSVFAQVQTVDDVSFAVPAGWAYQSGNGFGLMAYKEGDRFWAITVCASMPSTGNADADFKTAWTRVVLTMPDYKGVPGYSPYSTNKDIGYPGKYYDGSSVSNSTYTRLYILQAAERWIPVMEISNNRGVLDGMEHMAKAVVASVRLAPLKATPIQQTLKMSDMTGHWNEGLAFSTSYYNRSTGQYVGSQVTAYRADYAIAADGSYTYQMGGLMHNNYTKDDDSGVIQVSDGYLTFKGRKYVRRLRFIYLMQALNGDTVVAVFPDLEMSKIDSARDITFYTRPVKK
jgi:hypothetical protein